MNALSVPEPWDLVADGYAAEADDVMGPFSQRAAELAELDARTHVLDVAAGPGTLTLAIAKRVASVTAVDFSAEMLARLRARADALHLRNLQVLHADGQALPFGDGSFDAAFSIFGWMFFPDRARGLSELCRVVTPGGRVVVSSWAALDRSPLMAAMFGALAVANPGFVPPAYDPSSLENPDQLASELSAAGLTDVAIHAHTAGSHFDDTRALWARMTRVSAPLVVLRHRLGETEWARRSEIGCAYLVERLGAKPGPLESAAWLGIGRRA